METPEQHDATLIRSVEGATRPETQKSIPLTDELKQIGVDAIHIAGTTFDELMSGEGRDTRDRVAGKNPISLVRERARRFKSELKKAA